jgi:hypothetical protein
VTRASARNGGAANGTKEPGLAEIHTQLRIANRLSVAQLRTTIGQKELVRLLLGTGASSAEIADVLGTTPATVRVTTQRLKQENQAADPSPDSRDGASASASPVEEEA